MTTATASDRSVSTGAPSDRRSWPSSIDAVVDAVAEVERVLLRGDEMDPADRVDGVAHVWSAGAVEQAAAERPGRTVVVGDQEVRVTSDAAHEVVQPVAASGVEYRLE